MTLTNGAYELLLCLLLFITSLSCNAAQHKAPAEECLGFLRRHMPERDHGTATDQFLQEHVDLALQARQAGTWAQNVPWDVFLHHVLPYRNLDEPLDAWRPLFYELLMPLVQQAASTSEATQLLNQHIWSIWGIHFKADQAPEILSPTQVIKAGFGSCSALSIFLVNACRAVGVPARVAGTPSWVANRRGSADERFNNHNWVEIWDSGQWSFTGAAEFNAVGLNRTWFYPHPAKEQLPGDPMHAIYAASYATTGTHFPLAWAPHDRGVPAMDVTHAYLDAAVAMPRTVSASNWQVSAVQEDHQHSTSRTMQIGAAV